MVVNLEDMADPWKVKRFMLHRSLLGALQRNVFDGYVFVSFVQSWSLRLSCLKSI